VARGDEATGDTRGCGWSVVLPLSVLPLPPPRTPYSTACWRSWARILTACSPPSKAPPLFEICKSRLGVTDLQLLSSGYAVGTCGNDYGGRSVEPNITSGVAWCSSSTDMGRLVHQTGKVLICVIFGSSPCSLYLFFLPFAIRDLHRSIVALVLPCLAKDCSSLFIH
jgi:hypothetical protein